LTVESEPIDVAYVGGAIWLAYPDRLLKSNTTTSLSSVTTWETITIQPEMAITKICHLWERKLCVLDGQNGRLHVLDTDGSVVLSWAARGSNLGGGDISFSGAQNLHQIDGEGYLYVYDARL